jgi:hypothetical protein
MDQDWPKDLAIAVAGALIGSMLLYLFQVGFQWSANARKSTKQRRESDLADWKSGDPAKQQRVFNVYLFSVLKSFIIGNILIGTADFISYTEPNGLKGLYVYDYAAIVLTALGVGFFIATLAEILQFTKLVRSKP